MNILILNPPYKVAIIREGRCQSPQNMRKTCIPQMTLAYIASMLKNDNSDIKVYDCIALDLSENDLFDNLKNFKPDIAFINTTTPSINEDLLFVKSLKKKFPNCFTVIFGTHVTILHKEIMEQNLFVDCIIRHEPEWSVIKLVNALKKNIIKNGIENCTIRINKEIILAKEVNFEDNLDSLKYPAWEYFPKDKYYHPVFNKPYLMVNTSRGCKNNCIFCVASIFYGKKVRYRSVESIIDELENHVIGKFGIRYVWIYADDFTASPDFVKELCKAIINRRIKIKWWTNTRVDKPDEEMFRLMKKAGCIMLSIGGESGNKQILKTIMKGTKPEDIKDTVKILKKVGIYSLVYFLIGLPGETRETIKETIEFAKKINPDYVEYYPATPYPGTKFYDIALNLNLIVDHDWDNYMCGGNQFVIKIPGIEKDELSVILKTAYNNFYLRPIYVLMLLKRMLNPVEFFRLMKFGISYIKRFIIA